MRGVCTKHRPPCPADGPSNRRSASFPFVQTQARCALPLPLPGACTPSPAAATLKPPAPRAAWLWGLGRCSDVYMQIRVCELVSLRRFQAKKMNVKTRGQRQPELTLPTSTYEIITRQLLLKTIVMMTTMMTMMASSSTTALAE